MHQPIYFKRLSFQKSILDLFDNVRGLKFTLTVLDSCDPAPLVVAKMSGGRAEPGFNDIIGAEAIPTPITILLSPPENAPVPIVQAEEVLPISIA